MIKHMKVLLLSTVFVFTLLMVGTPTNAIIQTPQQNVPNNKNTAVIYMMFGDKGEIEQLYSYPAYQADR